MPFRKQAKKIRNSSQTRKSRNTRTTRTYRVSKRFFTRRTRIQKGGGWGFQIPDTAVVGDKNEEGVERFITMKEKREKKETELL